MERILGTGKDFGDWKCKFNQILWLMHVEETLSLLIKKDCWNLKENCLHLDLSWGYLVTKCYNFFFFQFFFFFQKLRGCVFLWEWQPIIRPIFFRPNFFQPKFIWPKIFRPIFFSANFFLANFFGQFFFRTIFFRLKFFFA